MSRGLLITTVRRVWLLCRPLELHAVDSLTQVRLPAAAPIGFRTRRSPASYLFDLSKRMTNYKSFADVQKILEIHRQCCMSMVYGGLQCYRVTRAEITACVALTARPNGGRRGPAFVPASPHGAHQHRCGATGCRSDRAPRPQARPQAFMRVNRPVCWHPLITDVTPAGQPGPRYSRGRRT